MMTRPLLLIAALTSLISPTPNEPLPTGLTPIPSCECTPDLIVEGTNAICAIVEAHPGSQFSHPLCNSFEGCNTLRNCNAAEGTVSVHIATWNPTNCGCLGDVTVLLNDYSQGTIAYNSSSTLSFGAGGSSVACTSTDQQEGSGDTVTLKCQWYDGEHSFDLKIKDKCIKCTGPSTE